MIYKLVESNHSILTQRLELFNFKDPPIDPVELGNNLIETMVANKGIGLSANQCGLPYRVFVMFSEQPFVCFNPRVVDVASEQILLDEGCLSFPNLWVKIKRPKMIKVRYQDAFGETHTQQLIGMSARCFLHELDHMDGIVYTRRANPFHLNQARNLKKKIDKGLKKIVIKEHKDGPQNTFLS